MSSVSENLKAAAAIFEERNKVYGEQYKDFCNVLSALFPGGFNLHNPDDFNRLGVFVPMITKIVRYCRNFDVPGGHPDSLKDIAVYAMMLLELDSEKEALEQKKVPF